MRNVGGILGCLVLVLAACPGDEPAVQDATTVEDIASDTLTDAGTNDAGDPMKAQREAVLAVGETERWEIPGLVEPVHVVRVEKGIPHIYAQSSEDLGRALGFTVARDRFMIMDLQRRLGTGTLSELLGDVGLPSDMESRYMGMRQTTQVIYESLSPNTAAYIDAFAAMLLCLVLFFK